MTPTQADKMITHNGTISGFGSGIGTAEIFTSYDFSGLSIGSPIYGSRLTRAITIVDKFNGILGAICGGEMTFLIIVYIFTVKRRRGFDCKEIHTKLAV